MHLSVLLFVSTYQNVRCRLLKGEGGDRGPLTPDELSRLQSQLDAWVSDASPSATLDLGGSMLHIRYPARSPVP